MCRGIALAAALGLALAPGAATAQVSFETRAEIEHVEHRVCAASPVQPASGVVFGGALGVILGHRFAVWGEARGGHLAPDSPDGEARDAAEVQLLAAATVRPWLTLQAAAHVRSYATAIARQRWSTLRLGAAARAPLAGESLSGMVRLQWMPHVVVSGLLAPDIALAVGAGVEWRGSRFGVGAVYTLERYDFPGSAGARRLEEFSALRVSASWRVGT